MTTAQLLQRVAELELPEDALDDAVHECVSQAASDINNSGFSAQIEYLLQHNEPAAVLQLIESAKTPAPAAS